MSVGGNLADPERERAEMPRAPQISFQIALLDLASEYCILTFGRDIIAKADQLGGARK
jgi:hypothetical protein